MNSPRPPSPNRKATDEQLLAAYSELKNVWQVGKQLGMCGQSVHERLVRLNAVIPKDYWKPEEDELLKREYDLHAANGTLRELAERMGRAKTCICRRARGLGLTERRRARPYIAVWKHMTEDSAQILFDKFRASKVKESVAAYCKRHRMDDLGFSRTMQGFFPAEWEALMELRQPKTTLYRLGRGFEYSVRDRLRKAGYFVMRSPASRSPVDLVAIRKNTPVLMIQCKRGGQLPVKDWNSLFDLAVSCGAIPLGAYKVGHHGIEVFRLVERKDGTKRSQPREDYDPWKPLAEVVQEVPYVDRRIERNGTAGARHPDPDPVARHVERRARR